MREMCCCLVGLVCCYFLIGAFQLKSMICCKSWLNLHLLRVIGGLYPPSKRLGFIFRKNSIIKEIKETFNLHRYERVKIKIKIKMDKCSDGLFMISNMQNWSENVSIIYRIGNGKLEEFNISEMEINRLN